MATFASTARGPVAGVVRGTYLIETTPDTHSGPWVIKDRIGICTRGREATEAAEAVLINSNGSTRTRTIAARLTLRPPIALDCEEEVGPFEPSGAHRPTPCTRRRKKPCASPRRRARV